MHTTNIITAAVNLSGAACVYFAPTKWSAVLVLAYMIISALSSLSDYKFHSHILPIHWYYRDFRVAEDIITTCVVAFFGWSVYAYDMPLDVYMIVVSVALLAAILFMPQIDGGEVWYAGFTVLWRIAIYSQLLTSLYYQRLALNGPTDPAIATLIWHMQ